MTKMTDTDFEDHVASFEANYPYVDHTKAAGRWGRIRYEKPFVDASFEAWARGRADLLFKLRAVSHD